MKENSRILVTGATGLLGRAIMKELEAQGYTNVNFILDRKHTDLENEANCQTIALNRYEYIFHCAAYTGGIMEAVSKPSEMLYHNMMMMPFLWHMAVESNRREPYNTYKRKTTVKLMNFGSSCCYPIGQSPPYKEEQFGTGPTDENWSYAISKIASVELCRSLNRQYGTNFINVIPCNIYGENDHFTSPNAHVIPALIHRFHQARIKGETYVKVWGDQHSGVLREFINSNDLARVCIYIMGNCNASDFKDGIINIGPGHDVDIRNLTNVIKDIIHPRAVVLHDWDKPRGVYKKTLDVSLMKDILGPQEFKPLPQGLEEVYEAYKNSPHSQPSESDER